MNVLAIDASCAYCGLAIVSKDAYFESVVHAPDGFSQLLFGKLEELLNTAGLSLGEISVFAAASGPGSFTGIRIALAAAKGLAEAQSRPLFCVSNLQALAWYGTGELRACILDARRGEIYAALYNRELKCISDEAVSAPRVWVESLPDCDLQFLCPDPTLAAACGIQDPVLAPPMLARAVGEIARTRFLSGEAPGPASADANYVRRSDAEMKWRDFNGPTSAQ